MKRIISLLLAFAMVLPNFTMFAGAEEPQILEAPVVIGEEPETLEEIVIPEAVITVPAEETLEPTEPAEEAGIPSDPQWSTSWTGKTTVTNTVTIREVEEHADGGRTYRDKTVTAEYEVPAEQGISTAEITEDGNSYSFTTFADLKELAGRSYDGYEFVEFWYTGTEALTIEESLTLPETARLYMFDFQLNVPEQVTLTLNHLSVEKLYVQGTVNAESITVLEHADVTGSVIAEQFILQFATYTTLAHISGRVSVAMSVRDMQALKDAIALAGADLNTDHNYKLHFSSQEITESVELPSNCSLFLGGQMIVAAGATLTLNSAHTLSNHLTVAGTLVNNATLDVCGTLQLEEGGSFVNNGTFLVDKDDEKTLAEILPGFDLSQWEINDKEGREWVWELNDASGLTKLATPTNLEWGIHHNLWVWDPDMQQTVLQEEAMPGCMSWQPGSPTQTKAKINVYREGEVEPVFRFNWNFGQQMQAWLSVDAFCKEPPISGTYYFTIQSIGDHVTYCNSEVVKSESWTYTRPTEYLDYCENPAWNWPYVTYSLPEDLTNINGFEVQFYFEGEDESWNQFSSTSSRTGTNGYFPEIQSYYLDRYSYGTYYFQVRPMSADITKVLPGVWSDLSPAYYFEGGEVTTPSTPEETEPEEETNGQCGDTAYWNFDKETGTLTISGTGELVSFPMDGSPWYHLLDRINTVIVEDGITVITHDAFNGSSVKKLVLADTVTSIHFNAFYDCTQLTDITMSSNIQDIGRDAFENTGWLNACTAGPNYLGTALIRYCDEAGVTKYTVEEGTTVIASKAFFNTQILEEVEIPESVRYIGENILQNSWYIMTLTFTGSAPETIAYNALADRILKVKYPGDNATWTADVMQQYGGDVTWQALTKEIAAPAVTISYDAATGKPKISWKAVEGAVKYQVLRSKTGKAGSFGVINTVTTLSTVNKNAVTGTTYYYKVRAVAADGSMSELSQAQSAVCKLPAPVLKSYSLADSGKIKLYWDAVEGASKYEIWRSKTGKTGSYGKIKTVTGTSFINTGAEAGVKYYYKIKAVHATAAATSEFSNSLWRTCDLAQPQITLTVDNATGKVKISWKAIEGAAKYEVWRSTSKDSGYTRLITTTATSQLNKNGVAGTTYYYKVRALHSVTDANSAYSPVKSALCKLAQPVVKASNIESTGNIMLSWEAVDGVSKYEVYCAKSKTGTYSLLATTTNLAYTHTDAALNTTYYYKVRAVHTNSKANSVYSAIVSRARMLARPALSVKNTDGGSIQLSWNKVANATHYLIYRSTSKTGTYKQIKKYSSATLKYADYDVPTGVVYYYRVKAVNTNTGVESAASVIVSAAEILATPVLKRIVRDDGQPSFSWESVHGASKYEIYRSTKQLTGYEKVLTTTSLKYTEVDLDVGVKYYYKVKAIYSKTAGNSAYSKVLGITCTLEKPSVEISYVDIGLKEFPKLKWKAVKGATEYKIYRKKTAEADSKYVLKKTTTNLSWTDKLVSSFTYYDYYVVAVYKNSAGNSKSYKVTAYCT